IKTHLVLKGQAAEKTNAEVLVGTPGAIIMAIKEKVFDPINIAIFVADEADVTMDIDGMGSTTMRVLREVLNAQKVFFSATYNTQMIKIINKYAPGALQFLNTKNKKKKKIRLFHMCVSRNDKIKTLLEIYELLSIGQSVVFVSTKKMVDRLRDIFTSDLHSVACLHGDMDDSERTRIVSDFRNAKTKILISTDLFSRGMDIPQVNLVINFDLPVYDRNANLQTYLNRIGRSGRFGRNGFVIDFVSSDEDKKVVMKFAREIDCKSEEISIEALREVYEEMETPKN
ncbi:ATP-dependent RNA helicase DBP5, partial [Dictyocoela roeselum]